MHYTLIHVIHNAFNYKPLCFSFLFIYFYLLLINIRILLMNQFNKSICFYFKVFLVITVKFQTLFLLRGKTRCGLRQNRWIGCFSHGSSNHLKSSAIPPSPTP